MSLIKLADFCREHIKNHPELKEQIADLYCLAKDEIEDEGSETHECELAMESINQLIEGKNG